MSRTTLTLAELEEYDPESPDNGHREKRYLCPFCGDTKAQDDAHRSLSLNQETGGWRCHRCDAKGYVPELRQQESSMGFGHTSRIRAQLARAFTVPSSSSEPAAVPMDQAELKQRLKGLVALKGSPGETYVIRRGIPVEIAAATRVKYHPNFSSRPALVFGIYDGTGQLVAAHGRYMDGRRDPPMRTWGEASAGVFATPGALEAAVLAVVEAPIDALSLCACGVPAVALLGTQNRPAWLPLALAGRTVLVATDSDEPGEKAATSLIEWLRPLGTRCWRLRPTGSKDWNEVLGTVGQATLAAQLADTLAPFLVSQPPEAPAVIQSLHAPAAAAPRTGGLPGDRLKSVERQWLCHACLLYFAEAELLVIEEDRFGRLRCSSCHAGEPLSPDQDTVKTQLLAELKVEDPMDARARNLREGIDFLLEAEDLDFLARYSHFIPAGQRTTILKNARLRVRVERAVEAWMKAYDTWRALCDEQWRLEKDGASEEQSGAIQVQVQTADEEAQMLRDEWERLRQQWEKRFRKSRRWG